MLRLGEGEVPGGAFRGHRGWGRALARSLAPAHPDTSRLGSRPTRCSAHCCPPLPVNLRSGSRDLHRTPRIQIPTTRHPPVALLRRGIPVPSGPAPRLPTYVSDTVGLLVALPCKQITPFRPPQSPSGPSPNPRKIVFFTQKLALCTKNDRIRPGALKTTYRYI